MIFGDRITGIICWITGDCRQYREPPLADTWGGKKGIGCRVGESADGRVSYG